MTPTPTSIQRMLCSTMACMLLGHASPPPRRSLPYRQLSSGDYAVVSGGPIRDSRSIEDKPVLASATHNMRLDSIPLETITTDTGSLAPGNKDFSRFTDLLACPYAVVVESQELRRFKSVQEAHFVRFLSDSSLFGESLPAGAVSVARACASRFTVETTAPNRWRDLFKLYLMAGQDSLAHAMLERRLVLAKESKDKLDRARVYWDAIDEYLWAPPARIAAAESTIARVDAMGTHWQTIRVRAHTSLLDVAMRRRNKQYMQREAERIIALGQEVPVREISADIRPFVSAYTALAEIAYIDHPDSLAAVLTRAKQDLSRFPLGTMIPSKRLYDTVDVFKINSNALRPLETNFKDMSMDQMKGFLIHEMGEGGRKLLADKPIPPVVASYWFPKPPDSWPPGKGQGRPSLVIYGPNDCGTQNYGVNKNFGSMIAYTDPIDYGFLNLDDQCNALTHWIKQYGNKLSITKVTQAKGYVAYNVIPPAAEADSLRWFFHDYLKLPITLGVVMDSVWQLPAIDGRQFHIDTNYYERNVRRPVFANVEGSDVVLFYDEHGALRYAGEFNWWFLQRLIDLSMGAPPMFPFFGTGSF